MDGPPGAALLTCRRDHPLRGTGAGRSGTTGRPTAEARPGDLKSRRRSATGRADGDHPRRFLAQRKRMLLDAPRGAPPAPYCEAPAGRPAGGVWRMGAGGRGAATENRSPASKSGLADFDTLSVISGKPEISGEGQR